MNLGVICLLALVIVVLVSFIFKLNVGLLAIVAATLIGYGSGQFSGKEIISGFSASLFITLLGVTVYFEIIQSNGCLEIIMKKIVMAMKKWIWIMPIMIFAIGYIIAAIGPGCVPAMAFAAAMAIPMAHETGYNPVMLLIMGNLGTYCGRFSPITPEGILISGLLNEQGLKISSASLMLSTFVGAFVLFIVVFIAFKGYKVMPVTEVKEKQIEETFTVKHAIALITVLVMILLVIFVKMDVGLASFMMAVFLIIVKIGDGKKAINNVPWNTLLMVCGFGMLMNLVVGTGGIEMLSDGMSTVMQPWSAAGIVGIIAAVMSWFSSAIGVVYPTLIPTISGLAKNLGGNVSVTELVTTIALFASVAGLSSASTGGAIIMGAIGGDKTFSERYPSDKMFVKMLFWAFACTGILAGLAFIGVFGWIV